MKAGSGTARWIAMAFVASGGPLWGQSPPPPLSGVTVDATVAFDSNSKIYTYRYKIIEPLAERTSDFVGGGRYYSSDRLNPADGCGEASAGMRFRGPRYRQRIQGHADLSI